MESQEITLKLKCSVDEFCNVLENKEFKVSLKFLLDDTYFISQKLDIKKLSVREILKEAVLLRNIDDYYINKKSYKLTFKKKEFDKNGNILNQSSVNCKIFDLEEGRNFLENIGYKEILNIKESDIVYQKDDLKIAIKDIENGDKLIEVETVENNIEFNTIEKLKEKILQMKLPIYEEDFFVKKAEVELEKKLKINDI